MKLIDRIGQRFGRWIVIERAPDKIAPTGRKRIAWLCKCDCGNYGEVSVDALRDKDSRSCGCLNIEEIRRRSIRHGLSFTKVHNAWCSIRQRCQNPNGDNYKDYGGRGIKVCDRWTIFENFLSDMGQPPSPLYSIERKNNDGDYSPENCKWATRREQSRNRRSNRRISINGKTRILTEWSEISGEARETIAYRLDHAGLSPYQAVFGRC